MKYLLSFYFILILTTNCQAQEYFGEEKLIMEFVVDNPRRLNTADFNFDGLDDLIISGDSGRDVFLAINDGTGSFKKPRLLFSLTDQALLFIGGDFTGNGHSDILIQYSGSSELELVINNGDETYTRGTLIDMQESANGSNPFLSVADLNSDGLLDFVFKCRWRANEGNGLFSEIQSFCNMSSIQSLDYGDVDNDGDLDLLVRGNLSGTRIETIGYNDGSGTFSYQSQAMLDDLNNLKFCDINADGHLDLIGEDDGQFFSYENDGSGGFSSTPQSTFTVANDDIEDVRVVDLNGDGLDDLIVQPDLFYPEGTYFLFNNYPNGWTQQFVELSDSFVPWLWAYDVVDRMGNGFAEPVFLTNDEVAYIENLGDDNMGVLSTLGMLSDKRFVIDYLDDNDQLDLVSNDTYTLNISYNWAFEEWTPSQTIRFEDRISNFKLYDLNQDGKKDILIGLRDFFVENTFALYFLENIGNEGFLEPQLIGDFVMPPPSGDFSFNIQSLHFADINNDGFVDALLDGYALLSDGASILETVPTLDILDLGLANQFWSYIVYEDLDNDGDIDLLDYRRNMTWYMNDGLGQFTNQGSVFGYEGTVNDIIITDYNQDGANDMIIVEEQNLYLLQYIAGSFQSELISSDLEPISVTQFDRRYAEVLEANGDSNLDIVGNERNRIYCLFTDDDGKPVHKVSVVTSGNLQDLHIVDYDNDGWLDIVYVNSDGYFMRPIEKQLRTPSTSFEVDPCQATEFTNTTYYDIPEEHLPEIEVLWDFGDGETSTQFQLEDFRHQYSETGTYTVSLAMCNEFVCDTLVQTIDVNYLPGINIENSGLVNEPVHFSCLAEGYDNVSWVLEGGPITSDLSFSHTYTEAGCYQVDLHLTDSSLVDCTFHRVFYLNIGLPPDECESEEVVFSSSVDPGVLLSNSDANVASVKVFNIWGACVRTIGATRLSNSTIVDELPAGIYFLRIEYENGNTELKQFLAY